MTSDGPPTPPMVARATAAATAASFPHSCTPAVGRLLTVLAANRPGGLLGESGTGYGVGAAWLASGMDADARLVMVQAHSRMLVSGSLDSRFRGSSRFPFQSSSRVTIRRIVRRSNRRITPMAGRVQQDRRIGASSRFAFACANVDFPLPLTPDVTSRIVCIRTDRKRERGGP